MTIFNFIYMNLLKKKKLYEYEHPEVDDCANETGIM